MNRQEINVMSSHGLSEQKEREPDTIKDIIDTVADIYCTLGKIDLIIDDPVISNLCVQAGVSCLHLRIITKDLRKKL